jgi:putative ABC transport system substrate-binding protein
MQRREFISVLGGAAAWPLAAHGQQGARVRRIGVLMPTDENDPEGERRYSAFTQALADLGWIDGRNVRMDVRWAGDDINRIRALAQELIGLQPERFSSAATASSTAGASNLPTWRRAIGFRQLMGAASMSQRAA